MLEIFSYDFMKTAFVVGILIAIIIPMIGVVVVLRHLSMMGDSLSHVSLAGVAAGLIGGINPVLGAVLAAIAGALCIEIIRKKIPDFSEVSIAIVSATGVGLAGVLSGFVNKSADFNAFLFGSIVAISDVEFFAVLALAMFILVIFALFWREFELLAFDEKLARLSGVPVSFINFILTILIALAVAISSRAVGALIVSGIMVVPVVNGILIGRGYKQTMFYSILFALISTISALYISYYLNLKPGGTIILISVILLVCSYIINYFVQKSKSNNK